MRRVELKLSVSLEVRSLGIFAAYSYCRGVRAESGRPDVHADLRLAVEKVASLSVDSLKNHPIIQAYRTVMWRLGIDPTKVRPSAEALVRRALRRGCLPKICSIVDACNIVSIETLVPISVFDANALTPPLTLRRARQGEEFVDFSGKVRKLKGEEIVLADGEDKILHLYPHRDSIHAAIVVGSTRDVFVVAYGAPEVPKALVLRAVNMLNAKLLKYYPEAECVEGRLAE